MTGLQPASILRALYQPEQAENGRPFDAQRNGTRRRRQVGEVAVEGRDVGVGAVGDVAGVCLDEVLVAVESAAGRLPATGSASLVRSVPLLVNSRSFQMRTDTHLLQDHWDFSSPYMSWWDDFWQNGLRDNTSLRIPVIYKLDQADAQFSNRYVAIVEEILALISPQWRRKINTRQKYLLREMDALSTTLKKHRIRNAPKPAPRPSRH